MRISRICSYFANAMDKDLNLDSFAIGWLCGVQEAVAYDSDEYLVAIMFINFQNRQIPLGE